jgi:Zn-dependent metalloprotease
MVRRSYTKELCIKIVGFRDMYNPNCYGDPVAMDDEFVWCNSADGGGVHANSGMKF